MKQKPRTTRRILNFPELKNVRKKMGEFRDEEAICKSMHHLSTAAAAVSESPEKHAVAASPAACFNSTKRQAPLSPFREPVSKRATLHFPSSPAAAAGDEYLAFGFKRLPLPHPFPAPPSPLRRTLSEPMHSPNAVPRPAPPPQSPEPSIPANPVPRQPLQEIPENNAATFLCRTVSDPNPFVNFQLVPAAGTPPHPPRPPLGRSVPRSPSCGESPSTKRLRRMKERLKEMSQWWDQVVHEGEEEGDELENYCTHNIQKEESEYKIANQSQKSNQIRKEESDYEKANPSQKSNLIQKAESDKEMGSPSQEAVWVEKNGECLVLHFKCPCGTGYQILLSGSDCYYKLTNF